MIQKLVASMFILILLYLAIKNADAVNNTINALAQVVGNQIKALQGRDPTYA